MLRLPRRLRRPLLIVACIAPTCFGLGGISSAGARGRTAAENRKAAIRDAAHLLAQVRLPVGAIALTREPAGDRGALGQPPQRVATPALVDRRGWWRVRRPAPDVLRFIASHPPGGRAQNVSGSSTGAGPLPSSFLGFGWPKVADVLAARELLVEVVDLGHGWAGVRADAEVVWVLPRPARERVPSGAHEVDVVRRTPGHPPAVSVRVRNPERVRSIIGMIDALPIVQPGMVACPLFPIRTDVPVVSLTFRARPRGPALATATEPADVVEPTTACRPLDFAIHRRVQTPLLRGANFLRRVQRLLGVTLSTRP